MTGLTEAVPSRTQWRVSLTSSTTRLSAHHIIAHYMSIVNALGKQDLVIGRLI